jgi:hypothetical protein
VIFLDKNGNKEEEKSKKIVKTGNENQEKKAPIAKKKKK